MRKKIFMLSGKAESGKTTCANLMALNAPNSIIANFAGPLKFYATSLFSWNGVKDAHGRKLLQDLGTQVRESYPDYWVQSLFQIITSTSSMWDNCFIDDWRYPNEFTYINNLINHEKFDIIRLRVERFENGSIFINSLSNEAKAHDSETALNHFPTDHVIINAKGIQELKGEVDEYIAKFV